jgi:hypothetical protein
VYAGGGILREGSAAGRESKCRIDLIHGARDSFDTNLTNVPRWLCCEMGMYAQSSS